MLTAVMYVARTNMFRGPLLHHTLAPEDHRLSPLGENRRRVLGKVMLTWQLVLRWYRSYGCSIR